MMREEVKIGSNQRRRRDEMKYCLGDLIRSEINRLIDRKND